MLRRQSCGTSTDASVQCPPGNHPHCANSTAHSTPAAALPLLSPPPCRPHATPPSLLSLLCSPRSWPPRCRPGAQAHLCCIRARLREHCAHLGEAAAVQRGTCRRDRAIQADLTRTDRPGHAVTGHPPLSHSPTPTPLTPGSHSLPHAGAPEGDFTRADGSGHVLRVPTIERRKQRLCRRCARA